MVVPIHGRGMSRSSGCGGQSDKPMCQLIIICCTPDIKVFSVDYTSTPFFIMVLIYRVGKVFSTRFVLRLFFARYIKKIAIYKSFIIILFHERLRYVLVDCAYDNQTECRQEFVAFWCSLLRVLSRQDIRNTQHASCAEAVQKYIRYSL